MIMLWIDWVKETMLLKLISHAFFFFTLIMWLLENYKFHTQLLVKFSWAFLSLSYFLARW